MITQDQMAEAARHADALLEEHQDIPRYWRERGVDLDGLIHVAVQRGLRAVMIKRGEKPGDIIRPASVRLSKREEVMVKTYAAMFLDGFAVRDRIETS